MSEEEAKGSVVEENLADVKVAEESMEWTSEDEGIIRFKYREPMNDASGKITGYNLNEGESKVKREDLVYNLEARKKMRSKLVSDSLEVEKKLAKAEENFKKNGFHKTKTAELVRLEKNMNNLFALNELRQMVDQINNFSKDIEAADKFINMRKKTLGLED